VIHHLLPGLLGWGGFDGNVVPNSVIRVDLRLIGLGVTNDPQCRSL
jgi:predicted secreted Zn-dependent protease